MKRINLNRINSFFFLTVLCLALIMTATKVRAAYPNIADGAKLLTETEAAGLQEQIDAIAVQNQFDMVILTILNLDGKSAAAYADDYYDSHGYGYGTGKDGILFLISMDDREWYISTCGSGIQYFTDRRIESIGSDMAPMLRGGDYAGAFALFIQTVESVLAAPPDPPVEQNAYTDYITQTPTDDMVLTLMIPVIALCIALAVTLYMKYKMNTARPQILAHNYTKPGSFNLTRQQDIFLFSNTVRRRKPDNDNSIGGSGTHTSSSGQTHGGGGGKF